MKESVVETLLGKVRGLEEDGVSIFLGLPYGAPTRSVNRFQPPAPAMPWAGVLSAIGVGPRAPQEDSSSDSNIWRGFMRDRSPQSEDCLVLKVYAPGKSSETLRPTMVWLHGGGFNSGAGYVSGTDGRYLARRNDVVVVTLNHRLNAFGFTYLKELARNGGGYTGNVGMLDIVAALRWVRDNIASFGGDPDNVTVFGQSGGGSKVAILMAMPTARGLFHKAIVQSASSLLRMASPEQASRCAELLLDELGASADDPTTFAKADMHSMLQARKRAVMRNGGRDDFRPVVDGDVLPVHPFEPAAPALAGDIPMMIGTCADETSYMMGGAGVHNFSLDAADARARVSHFMKLPPEQADALYDAFRSAHRNEAPSQIMIRIFSEEMYRRNCILAAERKSALGGASTFMYHVRWKTAALEGRLGSPHTLCIPLVFGTVDAALAMLGRREQALALSGKMMDAWAAFARTGNPNHAGLPDWRTFDTEQRATMIFDDECRTVHDPLSADRHAIHPYPLYTSDMVGRMN